jgi:hypothetical protein
MKTYAIETEWTASDLALLEELKRAEALLPADAPRALLSIRLSVLTEDTTSPVRQEKTRFTREQAEKTLDKLADELGAIDPETTQDRWTLIHNGKTFREAWESGGMEVMAEDLRRVGITCEVTRTKVKGVRAPSVHLRLKIPRDVRERLVIKSDDFAAKLWQQGQGRARLDSRATRHVGMPPRSLTSGDRSSHRSAVVELATPREAAIPRGSQGRRGPPEAQDETARLPTAEPWLRAALHRQESRTLEHHKRLTQRQTKAGRGSVLTQQGNGEGVGSSGRLRRHSRKPLHQCGPKGRQKGDTGS